MKKFGFLSLILVLFMSVTLLFAEKIGETEIYRQNGWVEKYSYNYPDSFMLWPSEKVVFISRLRNMAFIEGRDVKIDLQKPEWKNTSAWITIETAKPENPLLMLKVLKFDLNTKKGIEAYVFEKESKQGKGGALLSVTFPITQQDIDGEKYVLTIKNISTLPVVFSFADASNLPFLQGTWEQYHAGIQHYLKKKL